MYCPRCGQEQLSPEVRFCSRCGFQLRGVSQLLTTDGLLPGLDHPDEELTPRQLGLRSGAKVLFASFVSFPLTMAMGIMADAPVILVLSFVLFLVGLFRMLYARLFESDRGRSAYRAPALAAPPPAAALPPPQAPVRRPGVTTGELAEPPSVTEHTTRFLDQ